jgi:4-hydroxymandelate oxidase
VQNAKRRDRRNWFLPPYRAVQYARHHEPFPDIWQPGFPFTLDDLEWLRGVASVPIVVKGVMTAEDARAAVDAGADGIFVSNHGGRILDATLSTIETLPEVLAEVGDEVEVYLDGGIRRGTDVLKALALGARAVAVGRPWFWGLAVGGADGVHRVLRILREELDAALALCGQSSVLDLDDALLNVPREWGR